ncbi:MAG: helix-turn-helix transcriptional regulator [Candidatus Cloacimonetes bacterium]|nr:helix-turn-helix transcriptional regulator [Candidatus Cloacimonadota bacterium]
MSSVISKPTLVEIDKTEMKFIIKRHFGDQKDFCEIHDIKYGTLRHYLNGRNMPTIDRKILKIIHNLGYNPDGSRILPEGSPELKLQIVGNHDLEGK